MSTILEITGLCKNFGSLNILNNVNVSIDAGDFLVLVGPSGCGKSTLLNCIAGLEPITSGSITIAGRDMTHVSPKDRDIAMVFQSYALYPTMTVGKNITFGTKVRGVDMAGQEAKLAESPNSCRSSRCLTGVLHNCPVASASALPWAGLLFATQNCFSLTSLCRTLTPNCSLRCARRSRNCIRICMRRWFMSHMTRLRR